MISSCSPWMVATMSVIWPGPAPVEGGEQGRRAADRQVADQELPAGRRRVAPVGRLLDLGLPVAPEALVLDPDHLAPLEGEVPTQDETLGVAPGRPVEGLGDRRPPVDDQRLVVGVVDGEATDVEDLGRRPLPSLAVSGRARRPAPIDRPAVDPAEGERLVADVELLEAGEARPHDHVALGAGLERAALPQVEHALEHRVGVAAHGVEPRVRGVDELLLGLSLRVHPHLRLPSPARPGVAPPAPGKPSIVRPGRAGRVRRAPPLAGALS